MSEEVGSSYAGVRLGRPDHSGHRDGGFAGEFGELQAYQVALGALGVASLAAGNVVIG